MEYTAEDFTFWGQVVPQLWWIFIIVVGILVYSWHQNSLEEKKKKEAEIEKAKLQKKEDRIRRWKLLKESKGNSAQN